MTFFKFADCKFAKCNICERYLKISKLPFLAYKKRFVHLRPANLFGHDQVKYTTMTGSQLPFPPHARSIGLRLFNKKSEKIHFQRV